MNNEPARGFTKVPLRYYVCQQDSSFQVASRPAGEGGGGGCPVVFLYSSRDCVVMIHACDRFMACSVFLTVTFRRLHTGTGIYSDSGTEMELMPGRHPLLALLECYEP